MPRALSIRRSFSPSRAKRKFLYILGAATLALAVHQFRGNPTISTSGNDRLATFKLGNGYCVETITTKVPCHSWLVLHGTSLYSKGVLAFFYLLFLLYLFLGIAIVADIFMGAIEVITSKQVEQKLISEDGETKTVKVKVWNPTIANLTLMALGSSAPEILLSIIETVTTLNSAPGELGPSTIVGSAAFNLMGRCLCFHGWKGRILPGVSTFLTSCDCGFYLTWF